jgi:hypothetical protein
MEYNGEFGCGASLIHSEFVLTAAHCAYPEDLGDLVAVIIDIQTGNRMERPVRKILPHAAYDDVISTSNDVALLQIDPIIIDDANVVPWLLLTLADNRDGIQPGDSVTVIGMGSTETSEVSDVLRQVELEILGDEPCDDLYDGDIHHKSMICAIGKKEGGDACAGDSGGPLLVLGKDGGDDVQVGVVSFGGSKCGDPNQPGVYADVAFVKEWIDSTICQHSSKQEDCDITVDTDIAPILLEDTDVCRDFAGAFFVDGWHQFQRCDWLRKEGRVSQYCYRSHEAWVQCPFSCHGCTYEADDDYGTDDEYTNYDRSSTPAAWIALIVLLSTILVCLVCFCAFRKKQCRRSEILTTEECKDGDIPVHGLGNFEEGREFSKDDDDSPEQPPNNNTEIKGLNKIDSC